ncbi:uncharacterized protein N7511_005657 [Penicillium nucicola]|uniref:uncharacterized protein n=1 Tax=Penicillium nucicola TaxID=1850975 RepID=UPI002545AD49|nr:uncharacterized protein N7511_005657 [Penicillium nucicola]KAJ5762275.1 hypothetical protein N7511_005657 [Penicillium nucicola]
MRFITTSLFMVLASTALVAAQSATITSPSGNEQCTAVPIVQKCISIMQKGLDKCTKDDWDCKCSGAANIFGCYADCVGEDRVSAELLSEHDCRTANAYDKGRTTVNDVWTTPSPDAVEATPTEASTTAQSTSTSEPTKTLSEEKAATSKGAAAGKPVGTWLALVGFGLGVAF